MTTHPESSDPWESERRRLVAEEIFAWMGRRRVNQAALASKLGKSENYLSRRFNGKLPFSVDDLFKIADILDVPADRFLHVDRGDAVAGRTMTAATPLRRSRGSQAPSRSKSLAAVGVSCLGVSRRAA